MKRFMGLMPADCIKISKDYKDEFGLKVHIDAGLEGWTILYADGSSEYKDNIATSEENFEEAYKTVSKNLTLTEIKDTYTSEIFGEMRCLTPEENAKKSNMYRNMSTPVEGMDFN